MMRMMMRMRIRRMRMRRRRMRRRRRRRKTMAAERIRGSECSDSGKMPAEPFGRVICRLAVRGAS